MRNLTAGLVAQLQGTRMRPMVLVEIDFTNESIFVWSGVGSLTWNGHVWSGLGRLGAISPIVESTEIAAQNVTLTLSGIPPEMVTEVMSFVSQRSPVQVWFGTLTEDNQVIADPARCTNGFIDVPTLTDGVDTCTLALTVETPLVALKRASNGRFSDADQQKYFPGDLGFAYVTTLQNVYIQWPSPA